MVIVTKYTNQLCLFLNNSYFKWLRCSCPEFKVSYTVKPVLSGHSKIDKTKVLKTNGSLMKVESIAECFFGAGAFCNTFDLH